MWFTFVWNEWKWVGPPRGGTTVHINNIGRKTKINLYPGNWFLFRARRRGYIHFEGETLLKGKDDMEIVTLLNMPPKPWEWPTFHNSSCHALTPRHFPFWIFMDCREWPGPRARVPYSETPLKRYHFPHNLANRACQFWSKNSLEMRYSVISLYVWSRVCHEWEK